MPEMKTLTIGGTTYTIAGGVESVQGKTGNVVLDANDLKFLLPVDSVSGAVASFPDGADNVPVEALSITITPVQSGSGDPSPQNVRPISGWSEARIWCEATHDTSADPKVTIDLSGTRYGGTLDVKTGVLTVTHGIVDMGTLGWYNATLNGELGFAVANFPAVAPAANNKPADILCEAYNAVTADALWLATGQSGLISLNTSKTLQARNANYSDYTTFKASVVGVNLVYALATPVTVQLDPATLSTLYGANNIWANCGDVSVSYRADIQKYIDKKLS